MAFTKRPSAPSFTTDRGTFKFPKLNEPDTKFKADGEYSVKLVQSTAQAQRIIDLLEPHYRAAIAKADVAFKALPVKSRKEFEAKGIKGPVLSPLYSIIYDETTEEPTGDVEFIFKMAASGEYRDGKKAGQRWERRPDVFNDRGVKYDTLPEIWGGTEGKVSFELGTDREGAPGYFVPSSALAGVSLRLKGAQVLTLVSGGGRSAASHGFGDEGAYDEAPFDASDKSDF